jgi:hypothetical protein
LINQELIDAYKAGNLRFKGLLGLKGKCCLYSLKAHKKTKETQEIRLSFKESEDLMISTAVQLMSFDFD